MDPERYARAAPVTAVFTAGPDRAIEAVPACEDDWTVLLGPRPRTDPDAGVLTVDRPL
ncbi:hypothetical protein ACIRP2_03420 [Streptomyces sp. NPDC101194]|uniref:hypothetical protein n=1 Tax=Streptomyces sp. NPDC101194 TaxID=3366127 RepID=UPI0038276ECC